MSGVSSLRALHSSRSGRPPVGPSRILVALPMQTRRTATVLTIPNLQAGSVAAWQLQAHTITQKHTGVHKPQGDSSLVQKPQGDSSLVRCTFACATGLRCRPAGVRNSTCPTTSGSNSPQVFNIRSMAQRPVASLFGVGREPVYLVDFAVYKPPEELRMNRDAAETNARQW